MDPKKKELNPDLKQIYERVMNTPIRGQQASEANPVQAAPAPEQTPPASANPQAQTARPIPKASSGPFVFKSTNKSEESKEAPQTQTSQTAKKGISGLIIMVLVVVLLVVWGVFWAKFFALF